MLPDLFGLDHIILLLVVQELNNRHHCGRVVDLRVAVRRLARQLVDVLLHQVVHQGQAVAFPDAAFLRLGLQELLLHLLNAVSLCRGVEDFRWLSWCEQSGVDDIWLRLRTFPLFLVF